MSYPPPAPLAYARRDHSGDYGAISLQRSAGSRVPAVLLVVGQVVGSVVLWRCVPDASTERPSDDAATHLHSEDRETIRPAFDPVLWNHLKSQRLGAPRRGGGTIGLGRTVSLWLRGLSRDPQGAIAA